MATILTPRQLKARVSAQGRTGEAIDDLYVVGLLLAFALVAILLSLGVLGLTGQLANIAF